MTFFMMLAGYSAYVASVTFLLFGALIFVFSAFEATTYSDKMFGACCAAIGMAGLISLFIFSPDVADLAAYGLRHDGIN